MPSILSTLLTMAACTIKATSAASFGALDEELGEHDSQNCANLENWIYNSPSGGSWKVVCATDTAGNDHREEFVQASNFENCISKCSASGWCKYAAFVGDVNSAGNCYMKLGNGGRNIPNSGVKLAIRV